MIPCCKDDNCCEDQICCDVIPSSNKCCEEPANN